MINNWQKRCIRECPHLELLNDMIDEWLVGETDDRYFILKESVLQHFHKTYGPVDIDCEEYVLMKKAFSHLKLAQSKKPLACK